MKSVKYTVTRKNGTLCGLSIVEAETDDANPARIVLPLYPRDSTEIEKMDIKDYEVRRNNGTEHYEIIEMTKNPNKPSLLIKLIN